MRHDQVLWLCGPSGVGKSTVGFELFDQLSRAGTAVAYVDLDQLGLYYPAPAEDPDNHRVKARNLGEVWSGFRAAGARCLVVSGLVDSAEEVRRHADLLAGTTVTVCRLRVGQAELRDRILRRGTLLHLAEDNLRNAVELEGTGFADLVVDTGGRTVAEVVARIRGTGWPGRVPPREVQPPSTPEAGHTREWPFALHTNTHESAHPSGRVLVCRAKAPPSPVLWVCGPPAVGKSVVGWEILMRVVGRGVPAGYIDLAQIGFCRPAPADDPDHHRLKAYHLGRVGAGLLAAGARCLVVSGNVAEPATFGRYLDAIPSATWTVCRLRARPGTLTDRILLRGRGGGVPLPGDDLRGLPVAELRRRAAEAARIADVLDQAGIGDLRVDTEGRESAELADLVITESGGWPGRLGT